MNPGVTEEVGKATNMFMDIMRQQPLSLALVMMNLILLGFLFYSGASQLSQRRETVSLIVAWQQQADKLMADCVSKEVVQVIVNALERDRELYRSLLPKLQQLQLFDPVPMTPTSAPLLPPFPPPP